MDTTLLILIGTGLTAGVLSGLFGIGGGIVIVPALIYLLGFTTQKATGTSLVVLLPPVGIGAVLEYARNGQVDWKAALAIVIGLFLGATFGAIFANKISPASMKLLFSLFIIGMGFYSLYNALIQLNPPVRQSTQLISKGKLS